MTDASEPHKYTIPMENFGKFTYEMEKLCRRSMRLTGQPIVYKEVGIVEVKRGKVMVPAQQIVFERPSFKIGDWTFLAAIDHSHEAGNIIRKVPDAAMEIPATFREAIPNCDHCDANGRGRRYRRDTYLLGCEATGEIKQVGKSCLRDFTGMDAGKIAFAAELFGFADECARGSEEDECGGSHRRPRFGVTTFLGYTAMSIRKNGWVSRSAAKATDGALPPTSADVMGFYAPPGYRKPEYQGLPTREDLALATAAQDWAVSLSERDDLNDYEHALTVLAQSVYIELRSLGQAASIIAAYQRHQGTLARREIERKRCAASKHFGTKGERIKKMAMTLVSRFARESLFGTTHTYKFMTDDGSVAIWFGSVNVDAEQGTRFMVDCTIDKHDEYHGVKTTYLKRCKLHPATVPAEGA